MYIKQKDKSIYAIRCNSTGRLYIGMSGRIGDRINEHLAMLRRGNHDVKLLQADYNTYGKEDFSFYVLEEGLSDSEARQREQDFMSMYATRNPQYGYNRTHHTYGTSNKINPQPSLIYAKPPKPDILETERSEIL